MSKRLLSVLFLFAMTASPSLPDASVPTRTAGERVDLLVLGGTIVTMDDARR